MIDLIISGITPPLLVVFFIYRNDLYETEPHNLLVKTFFLGLLITIPMILFEIGTQTLIKNLFLFSLFGVALVEEGIKYLVLIFYNSPKKDFNEPYDGIIYSVVLTMGFALVENLMYIIGSDSGHDVSTLRMLTAIPMHATCGIVMGYFLGKAKMEEKRKKLNLIISLLAPVLIHGLYNYFIFIGVFGFSLIILIVAVVYSLKAIKIHQKNSPFKQKK